MSYVVHIVLLLAWVLWPAPDSRAGVIVRIEPQGMFDFAGTAEKAINYSAQRRFVWVNCPHFRGKKAVRILSRMYSSSR